MLSVYLFDGESFRLVMQGGLKSGKSPASPPRRKQGGSYEATKGRRNQNIAKKMSSPYDSLSRDNTRQKPKNSSCLWPKPT